LEIGAPIADYGAGVRRHRLQRATNTGGADSNGTKWHFLTGRAK